MTERTKRVVGRPFPRGVSGNPGGRPRDGTHVTTLARKHTVEAINALVLALKSPRERVPAAVALLAHGWGKPVQMISADPDQPLLVDFQWADASPATHTDARAVGTQIEPQIIEAVVADETDSA